MRTVNIVIVYNQDKTKVLMCLRQKNPYLGLYNFVGGKVEANETIIESCYRELNEETGITSQQIELDHVMTFQYHFLDYQLAIAVGQVDESIPLKSEKHPLFWISVEEDFENRERFAGDGNIQHMLDVLQYSQFNF